jgi:hypothetical protein
MFESIERRDHFKKVDLFARRRSPTKNVQTRRYQPLLNLQQLLVQLKHSGIALSGVHLGHGF